jgi:hypothetical protein
MSYEIIISKIGNLSTLVQDGMLILIVIGISLLLGLLIGKQKLIAMLISTYISLTFLLIVPKIYLENYSYQLIFFFVSLILITFFSREIFQVHISTAGFLWRVFVLAFLETILLINIIVSILPKKLVLEHISQNAYSYLSYPYVYFICLVMPIVFVYLIRRNLN